MEGDKVAALTAPAASDSWVAKVSQRYRTERGESFAAAAFGDRMNGEMATHPSASASGESEEKLQVK